jgi:hypothetical protein
MKRSRLALLVAVTACADSAVEPVTPSASRIGVWAPTPDATIVKASNSGMENPRLAIVGDRATWVSVWTDVWKGTANPPTMPEYDFVLAGVVVVGTGRRGPGYIVTIDSIVHYASHSELHATEEQPAAGCQTGTTASAPVHLAFIVGHPVVTQWRIGISQKTC